jgi:long-chain acyl-CoA synthetase
VYPFSLLPLSLAAHGGRVDGHESQQLVAAGLTLLQRSAPLVRALSGKRAAILLPTSPAYFVALAACEGRGVVLINPLASPFEISYQIADAGVGAVFTTSALSRRLPADVARVHLDEAPRRAQVVVNGSVREVDLGSHVGLSLEGDSDVAGSDDEAVIVYTSAMAGRPLGVILSHANLLANARSTIAATDQQPDDRVLALLPFSHLFGLTVTGSAPLLAGASIVTMPRFTPARAAELIALGEVTEVVGVPAVFRALISALEKRGGASGSSGGALRLCICGGSPLPVELQSRWFDATGTELRQGYGLTETGPVCLFNRVDRPNMRGTLGVPLTGVDVELHAPMQWTAAGVQAPTSDDDGAATEGEICVRGENVFRGYVGSASGGLAIRDGWLHTGDLGRRNADGTFEFTNVVKPMFTRHGFNIYPREIETAVAAMPGVDSVAVREQPVEDDEPEIVVEVSGAVDSEAVKRWCTERLSAYKQPTIISVL